MANKKLGRLMSSDERFLQPRNILTGHDVLEGTCATHTLPLEKVKWTALHQAVELGRIEEVKRILESKKWKHAHYYKDEWTPLHEACSNGETFIVSMLLEHGADVNFTTEASWTALHVASEIGNLETIQFLADYGADINCQDATSWTPLHLSSYYGHLQTVQFLLERSILSIDVKAETLWTPLQIAAYRGHLEIVRTLVDAGAIFTQEAKFPALLLACGEGHDSVATYLLERSNNVLYKKETILVSLSRLVQIGHLRVVRQLLDHFGNVCYKDSALQAALGLAVSFGDDELVKKILKLGADPSENVIMKEGGCLVSCALQKGFLDIAAILLAYGTHETKVQVSQNVFNSRCRQTCYVCVSIKE